MKRLLYTTLGLFGMFSIYAQANNDSDRVVQHNTVAMEEKVFESTPITVSDLAMPVKVKLQGEGSYEVNGKDMGKEATVVKNGDVIVLKQKAPQRDEAKVSTTLVIGDKYDRFTIVTKKDEKLYHVCNTYAKIGELPGDKCH
jgi:hypothetical protein